MRRRAVSCILFLALMVLIRSRLMALGSPIASATKRVFLIRHGQAEHNVLFEGGRKEEGKKILDPGLTEKGHSQALSVRTNPLLKKFFESKGHNHVIVTSPLRRTIQTTLNAFGTWRDEVNTEHGRHITILCNPDIQETGEIRCDCGRPLDQVKSEFGLKYPYLDFSNVHDDWHLKQGDYRDRGDLLRKRFNRFTKWIHELPEENVVVVGHHNIFLANVGVSFLNCEVREFEVSPNGTWIPITPKVSNHDDELMEEEKTHVSIYGGHCKMKMEGWGLEVPGRFR
ncbi:hypothetical protein AAMO2058_000014200 [Amorphochlora amoebiformis]